MNKKALSFIKNLSYILSSNSVVMFASIVVTLVVPKFIGIGEYGYWQIYLLYISYVGFLHFGWNDGIYLRYGGKEYKELNSNLFFSQFWMLIISQLIIALLIGLYSVLFIIDLNKQFIIRMTSVGLILTNVRYMLLYILQGTNRIKEYSLITAVDRISYILIIIILFLYGFNNFKLIIIADLIGRLLSLILAIFYCKNIVFRKISNFYLSTKETYLNISIGIKLMFANIAGSLIIGIVRFGIERNWNVETFGKISLTLTISNMLMLFINAIGLVMFPMLRRTDKNKLPEIYNSFRDFLIVFLFLVLIIYYPMKEILSIWLPEYSDTLIYMAFLLPICVYEGKMALLINPYLKTFRKENILLKVNIITVVFSLVFTIITTVVMHDIKLTVLSIIFLLIIRSILAELYLSTILKINVVKDLILEILMTVIFISSAVAFNSPLTMIVYSVAYLFYIYIKRRDIISTVSIIKQIINNNKNN